MTALDGPSAPQTRMLLASDGSTTTLLQALLGEELELRLDGVDVRTGGDVAEAARAALGIDEDASVLVRRSALVTRAGVEVSRNRVVASALASDVIGRVLTGAKPIGTIMNGRRAGHHRIPLESGWSWWDPAGARLPCAFKAYVIVEDGTPAIHVFERFNPRFIPTAGYPMVPLHVARGGLVDSTATEWRGGR